MYKLYFNPVIAKIGPFQLRWYGLMYALAFIAGYLYLHYSNSGRHLSLNKKQKDTLAMLVIAGVLAGGRLGYILFYNLPYYLANPLKMLAVWEGGMSFHGGLLAVILTIYWFTKKYRANFLKLTDFVAVVAPIGLFLGRIGNFINGELYGRVAQNGNFLSKLCIYFPADPQNCRYPSQLFESVLEGFVLFAVLYFMSKKNKTPGAISAFFLIIYGIFRIIIEFFREPDMQIGYLAGGITEGQLLSFFMIIGGIFLLWKTGRRMATRAHSSGT